MDALPMGNGDSQDKVIAMQCNYACKEKKETRGTVVSKGQGSGSYEEDELEVNGVADKLDSGAEEVVMTPDGLQNLQPRGPVVHWESFLSVRSLKVLLVENDDSTRHVVSALLQNCGYEVTAVANGLQAWNILEDLTIHIDIVLTESRGSGSESGTESKKSAKSKSNDESGNDTSSSEERDYGSTGISLRDGSDNGSDTRSSWTKRVFDADSPQPISPRDHSADAPDNTRAQVIHAKPEKINDRSVDVTETKECQKQDEHFHTASLHACLKYHHKSSTRSTSESQNKFHGLDILLSNKDEPEHKSEMTSGKPENHSANTVSAIGSCNHPPADSLSFEVANDLTSKVNDRRESPSLELTLERLRGVGESEANRHKNCNVLRHSGLSAFSRYIAAASANQAPAGNVGSCSPQHNSSVATKIESMHNSFYTPLIQESNGSSNNDIVSTTRYLLKPYASTDKSQFDSTSKHIYSSTVQSVQNGCLCDLQQEIPGKEVNVTFCIDQIHVNGSKQQAQVKHDHNCCHHCLHRGQRREHQPQLDPDDLKLKNTAATAPQCASSNMVGEPIEGNTGNYSVNGSSSGSNRGSNGQNGSSNALNTGATNMEKGKEVAGNNVVFAISRKVNENGAGEDRLALREAALTKFRQKRKERCFEKKE